MTWHGNNDFVVYPKILRKQPTAVFHSSPSSPTISSAVSPGVISTVLDESVLLVLRHVFCFFLARCGNTPLQKKKTRTLYIYTISTTLQKQPFKPTMASFNPQNILVPKMQRKQTTKLPKKGGAFQNKSFLLLIEEILSPVNFPKYSHFSWGFYTIF